AKIVGVSPATISLVFNNKPGISDATREEVLKAAAQYGYTYKKSEKKDVSTSVIQFVTYKKHEKILADTPFFSELTEGISQECSLQNCAVNMSYIHGDGDIQEQIDALRRTDCIGILLLATEMSPEDFRWFQDFKVPIVVLDSYYDGLEFDCVLINNIQGAFQATDYLAQCGHTNIGYLHSNIPIGNFYERADGFYKALRVNHISTSKCPVHLISPTSGEGYLDMMKILKGGPELADAYFADNDIIAAAAMKAFQEVGYQIPEDISIIGFDDMPLCKMMTPSLSTMNVRKRDLGAAAIKQLLVRTKEPDRLYLKMSMSTTLVCRESVSDLSHS
ncbi:MAG: LacI family DNA-binding transcriptional regulator, partial [Lachnospiraceae bacterium]|nr:LacI family DNA-binding transcriptional regulator [Lachnospiraceae bacterium]